MWPFSSAKDRLELIREIRKPAPGMIWSTTAPVARENAFPRVSADFTERTVVIHIPEVCSLSMSVDIAEGFRDNLNRAIEAVRAEGDVDITADVEKEQAK